MERGITIQKILGHESVEMALVSIGLTDEDVRQDYQNVQGSDSLLSPHQRDDVRVSGMKVIL